MRNIHFWELTKALMYALPDWKSSALITDEPRRRCGYGEPTKGSAKETICV